MTSAGAASLRAPSRWPLLAFAVAAGAVDAASYLGLGRVFTANMTGNSVLLTVAAAEHSGPRAARSGMALAGFCAGVLFGVVAHAGKRERRWPANVAGTVLLGVATLAGTGVGWVVAGAHPGGAALYLLILGSGLSMGLQSEATRLSGVSGISTTYMTGTLTRAIEGMVARAQRRAATREEHAVGLRASIWLIYVAGAAAGAFTERSWHGAAMALPVVLAAAVALAALRQRRAARA